MATTVANVPVGGRVYTIDGADKVTVTDITIADNSEVVTAEQLNLSAVYFAEGSVQDGQASDTAVYVTCTPSAGSNSVTVALFDAAGSAATTSATTVVRVKARGY